MSYRANNWAKLQKAGGPGRKGLLLLLADMCNDELTCFPSVQLLAQIMEVSERYVRGMLQDLEDLKLIKSKLQYRNGRRTSSEYQLLVPEEFTEVSVSAHYRNHSSATTGTMVPGLPEPWMRAEPPVEPPSEPPEASAVAEAGADAVASSSANAVAFAAARGQSAKIPKQRQAAAARDDPRKEHVTYYDTHGDVEATNRQIWTAINKLSDAGVEALMAEFKRYRPKIARDCRADAEGQLGDNDDEVRLLRLTLKYGVQHYGGHWPKFVLPPSMRSAAKPAAQAA